MEPPSPPPAPLKAKSASAALDSTTPVSVEPHAPTYINSKIIRDKINNIKPTPDSGAKRLIVLFEACSNIFFQNRSYFCFIWRYQEPVLRLLFGSLW